MATTVQQAAVNALVTYLRAELPDVTVSDEWPAGEAALPEKAITVLMAGRRQDTPADARVVAVTGTGASRIFTWRVTTSTQPLQLDLWARYPAARDDIEARLDDSLHKGTLSTLYGGVPIAGSWEPTRDGLLLALDPTSGHEGFVDFTFDGPAPNDTPDAALRHEWRATITGDVSMVLTVRTTLPTIRYVGLLLRAGETPEDIVAEQVPAMAAMAAASSPSIVLAGSTGNAISLTGVLTEWTSGTPGAPAFTASSGTIAAQEVTSLLSAEIDFDAPATAATVTIRDPDDDLVVAVEVRAVATGYALSGAASGSVGVPMTCTVALPALQAIASAVTVTPSDGGAGGSFAPASVTLDAYSLADSATFAYTPAATGEVEISTANDGGLTDPDPLTVTVTA